MLWVFLGPFVGPGCCVSGVHSVVCATAARQCSTPAPPSCPGPTLTAPPHPPCRSFGRSSIQPAQMASFRQRMGSCLGFDARAAAPTAPAQVLLIDRPYEEVRHLINVKELVEHLEAAYFKRVANVSLRYMEVGAHAEARGEVGWHGGSSLGGVPPAAQTVGVTAGGGTMWGYAAACFRGPLAPAAALAQVAQCEAQYRCCAPMAALLRGMVPGPKLLLTHLWEC
jgi:hypothetical protein